MSVNGHSARQYCSQGQVRTAALALKLAEREIHQDTFGEYPVMLLDDVLVLTDNASVQTIVTSVKTLIEADAAANAASAVTLLRSVETLL